MSKATYVARGSSITARSQTENLQHRCAGLHDRKVAIRLQDELLSQDGRVQGPVGSFPDYSIRYRHLKLPKPNRYASVSIMPCGADWVWLQALRDQYSVPSSSNEHNKLGRHGEAHMLFLSDRGVQIWTQYAKSRGIHFYGSTYRRLAKPEVIVREFRKAKQQGLVPCAARSPEGQARRRSRRALQLKTREGLLAEEVSEPLRLRPSRTSRQLRASWLRAGGNEPVTEFIKRQDVSPILSLSVLRRPHPTPGIVVDAVNKIYDNVIYEPKVHEFGREAKTGGLPTAKIPPNKVSRERLRTVLNPIRVGQVIGIDGQTYHRLLCGTTIVGPPQFGDKKYWYYFRKRGIFHLSEHHPLPDDNRYFT